MLTPKVSYLGLPYPARPAVRPPGASIGWRNRSVERLPAWQLDRDRRRSARAAVDPRGTVK
jgi:hypothetical protein